MAIYENGCLILSTGRKLCGMYGVFGIGHDLIAHHGFDGDVENEQDRLTPEERKELAAYMTDLWQRYGNLN